MRTRTVVATDQVIDARAEAMKVAGEMARCSGLSDDALTDEVQEWLRVRALRLGDALQRMVRAEPLDAALVNQGLCGVRLGDTGNHCEFVAAHDGKHGVWMPE